MTHNINEYLNSWVLKRLDYELQAKGKAKLNNECWRKLRNYHMQSYLKSLENPFAFLFDIKYKHRSLQKQIEGLNTLYYMELKKRQEKFQLNRDNFIKAKITNLAKR